MPIMGPQRLAVFLARFSDSEAEPTNDVSFIRDLFVTRGSGGLNDYWTAASMGAISLDGTDVFGWTTLDSTRQDFIDAHVGRWDKIKGAVDAFGIDTAAYAGVVALFNVEVGDAGAQGGVLAGPGDTNLTFLAHEIGHVFGLEHSFDTSSRKLAPWSQEGEYFDRHDIMSAMNVLSDAGHRFSPRGPLLNAANLLRMGWLPPERVFRPPSHASSGIYEVEIGALGGDSEAGFLAADLGTVVAEFRMNDRFDAGLTRPTVLIHQKAEPSSVIIASDPATFVHEWQPGQTYDATLELLGQTGGIRITVRSFDLNRRTARLELQILAARPPFRSISEQTVLGGGGMLISVIDGKIVRHPIPDPRMVDLLARSGMLQRDLAVFQDAAISQQQGFRGV